MLKVEKVCKDFGSHRVLDGVDLTIEPGQVVSVLGSSGSGKSTLIRCINGLEKLDAGRITIDDFDVAKPRDLTEARKRSATVFQLFNLYPHLTVLQNITLAPLEVLRQSRAEAEHRAIVLLEQVGMRDKAASYPAQLSGGQRQRVGICRALAMNPRYLLLDEVTSALDPEMTAEVLAILAKLARSGTTMLFVTHEVEFARRISDRIVFLEHGRLLVDLPTQAFFAPEVGRDHPRIAQFLSKMRKD